jgi:hypothetical protein
MQRINLKRNSLFFGNVRVFVALTLLFFVMGMETARAQAVGGACSTAGQIVRETGIGAATGIICNGTTYDAYQSYSTPHIK